MHMNKTKSLIWLIASITAGSALYSDLPSHWRHWWYDFQLWIQGGNPYKSFPFWVLPSVVFFDLILIFKLIASYGLFKFQSWGRTLAIYVLSTDFLIRLAGFINMVTYHWRHPEMIQRYKEWMATHEQVQRITISLIPGYIIGLLSLISVIILIIRPVKERFVRVSVEALKSENA
jgi:hypothetical protein